MLFSWPTWVMFFQSPILVFITLLIVTHVIYYFYFRRIVPSISSGAILMALSIFCIACLPELPHTQLILLMAAFQVVILWVYISLRLFQAYLQNALSFSYPERFAIGTWITGTVGTVLLFYEAEPTLHGFIVLLGLSASLLYIIYFGMIVYWLVKNGYQHFQAPRSHTILLAAISTEAIVLLLHELFRNDVPVMFYQSLIGVGIIFYLLGLYSLIRYCVLVRMHGLTAYWPMILPIHYGAAAIIGFVFIQSHVTPFFLVDITWWWTALACFVTILFELYYAILKIKHKGIKGILIYHTSQWMRIFALCIFYEFTIEFSKIHDENIIIDTIAYYGQYPITVLLIIEIMMVLAFVKKTNLHNQGITDEEFII